MEFIELFTNMVVNELSKQEFKEKMLHPLLKWFLWQIIPYVLLIICVNFFLTIIAICLVLYFTPK
jgi:cell division septal protein FtsQ